MPVSELPKYEQVKKQLIADISAGRWPAGGAIPSEAQLLKRFSVSRPTLVRSLQDLVREGYLYRHQGKGTFVAGRNGNGSGQAQRSVPVFAERNVAEGEILLRMLRGVASVLGPAHVDLALRYASAGPIDDETKLYLDKAEAGVALVVEPSFSPELHAALRDRGWTVWAINEPAPGGNAVCIDQQRAGYLATQYLIGKGARRIALLNGPTQSYWGFSARLDGYLSALREAGIEPDPRLIREGRHVIDHEAGRFMMRALLDEGLSVDGAVGASDSKAIGAVAAAQEAGLRVPEDLAVVGIDDILAAHATPPLPSINMPFEAVGHRAAEEALRSLNPPHTVADVPAEIILKPALVER